MDYTITIFNNIIHALVLRIITRQINKTRMSFGDQIRKHNYGFDLKRERITNTKTKIDYFDVKVFN